MSNKNWDDSPTQEQIWNTLQYIFINFQMFFVNLCGYLKLKLFAIKTHLFIFSC